MTKLVAAIFAFSTVLGQDDNADVSRILHQLLYNRRNLNLETLSPEVRTGIITRLRNILDGSDRVYGGEHAPFNRGSAIVGLVRMEDEQGMADYMEDYRKWNAKYGASRIPLDENLKVLPASIISKFAESFYRQDGDEIGWVSVNECSAWLVSPMSICSASYAVGIMHYSADFSDEVREWAGRLWRATGSESFDPPITIASYKPRSAVQFRQIMRDWWRENEVHFAAKDYASVRPGGLLDGMQLSARNVRAATPTMFPGNRPAPANTSSLPVGAGGSSSDPYIIPAAIGFSLLTAGAGVVFLRRKKSR